MRIKTKESLRNIKTFDRVGELAGRTKNGISGLNSNAEQTQGTGYDSETEYGGEQIDNVVETGSAFTIRETDRFGQWGVRETRRNILKYCNRPKPNKSLKSAPKKVAKTAQKTAQNTQKALKAVEKTAKATAKASQKAVAAARRAAQATVKAVKVAVRVTIATVKAIIVGVKALIAAIAAGGWIAVVIIIVICVVAMAAGSIYAIFYSDDSGGGIRLSEIVSDTNNEYLAKQNELRSQYAYDYCVYDGTRTEWSSVIAVYAVKVNMDPDNPQEIATFNEKKAEILKLLFWEMNALSAYLEERTETEEHAEVQSDGTIKNVIVEVQRTYLHIVTAGVSADIMANQYDFSAEQRRQLDELLSDDYVELWSQVIE